MSKQDVPSPEIKARSGPSLVWLIPLVVLAVGAWLIYDTLSKRGPDITIAFRTADGIEAGKTKLRYKNIEIGVVESVRFSDDFSHVLLKAQMELGADTFCGEARGFGWSVRGCARGVSGLSTLVSGAYIEVELGAGLIKGTLKGLSHRRLCADEAGRRDVNRQPSRVFGSGFSGSAENSSRRSARA